MRGIIAGLWMASSWEAFSIFLCYLEYSVLGVINLLLFIAFLSNRHIYVLSKMFAVLSGLI